MITAGIALVMARVGFYLMGSVDPSVDFGGWRDIKWLAWSSAVSVATWTVIGSIARRHDSWLLWAVLGLLSPLMGSLFFFPATPLALGAIFLHYRIVFTVGLTTGLLAAQISDFGRMRGWFGFGGTSL